MSDTREAKLAKIGALVVTALSEAEIMPDDVRAKHRERLCIHVPFLLSEIDRLESERRELRLRVLRLERENVSLQLLTGQLRAIADAAVDVLWNAKKTDDPTVEEVPARLTRRLMDAAGPWLESQDWRDMVEAQVEGVAGSAEANEGVG